MKIINPYTEILTPLDGQAILQHIELCGRVCYKSEDKITDTSAAKFVAGIIKRGHEAVLEHFDITVKFICDRGVSHEIVRHRLASYCQESTRYCNYSKDAFGSEITVIRPSFLTEGTPGWHTVYFQKGNTVCTLDWNYWERTTDKEKQLYQDAFETLSALYGEFIPKK